MLPELNQYTVAGRSRPGERGDMAEWVKRAFSKGDIDRAGNILRGWWSEVPTRVLAQMNEEERERVWWAWGVAENWRTSHAMPLLTFRMGLAQRVKRVQRDALIAQRMKRMTSILNKLEREEKMPLSQIQDLGGCRTIVADVEAVYRIYDLYRGTTPQGLFDEGIASAPKCRDYIRDPKPDGYRGIHIVGRYSARFESNEHWNGHRIEIQIRTKLQHAFATAVETVTTFTREPLKFGSGPDKWRRFFSLAGSVFAFVEQTSQIPGTPEQIGDLTGELRELVRELKVRQRLRGWTKALTALPRRNVKGAEWLLLVLDVEKNTFKVTGFADRLKAAGAIAEIEQSNRAHFLDAVLVWVRSAKDLRATYPNYYADTREFLKALDEALR